MKNDWQTSLSVSLAYKELRYVGQPMEVQIKEKQGGKIFFFLTLGKLEEEWIRSRGHGDD